MGYIIHGSKHIILIALIILLVLILSSCKKNNEVSFEDRNNYITNANFNFYDYESYFNNNMQTISIDSIYDNAGIETVLIIDFSTDGSYYSKSFGDTYTMYLTFSGVVVKVLTANTVYVREFDNRIDFDYSFLKNNKIEKIELLITPINDGYINFSFSSIRNYLVKREFTSSSDFEYLKVDDYNLSLNKYCGTSDYIDIPSTVGSYTVSELGDSLFEGNCYLESIVVPNTISEISCSCFKECNNLRNVNLPSTIKKIRAEAFYHCSNLESIILPNDIDEINYSAFEGCSSLININIPSSLTRVALDIFKDCNNLDLTQYDNAYYLGSNDNPYYLLYSSIDCDITEINIHNDTKIIGERAFEENSDIERIDLPEGLKVISFFAFNKCTSLKYINIPDSIEITHPWAFAYCDNIEFSKYDGADYLGNETNPYLLLFEGKNFTNDSTINPTTRIIYHYAFEYTSITRITIPNSVQYLGMMAFFYCEDLESITLSNNIKEIGAYAFEACTKLKSITIPSGITSIPEDCFHWCYELETVNLPNGIKEIGYEAFGKCYSLKNINLPNSIREIAPYAFTECNSLECVSLPSRLKRLEDYTFYGCASLKEVVIPKGVTFIGERAVSCCDLRTLEIPSTVRVISAVSFNGNPNLETIIINDGVEEIGDNAFSGSESLKYAVLPNSLTSIGGYVFSSCGSKYKLFFEGTSEDFKSINVKYLGNLYFYSDCIPAYYGYWHYDESEPVAWEDIY